ncbi:MAG TPA: Trp biosynthesis-associated membrane protein [Dietzia timorensis]|uniref:Trp biosynthesis-associated membrane protein n=1 Tax=Dietzia timorensis TaxID=499555 RepID=A0A921F0F0_9ACTN|nr:Trp biosynthesis-associated membrane protein [Dietzia timorensis]HJE89456.1 Trp biosynthesis-associated membrane protein [Dietzia timorensis]
MKRSPLALSLLLIALGALALWGSTRLAWIDAVVAADQFGVQERTLTGAKWSPESTAVALGLVATGAVLMFTRGLTARIVAAVALVLAILGGLSGVMALAGSPDGSRVHSVLTNSDAVARTSGVSDDEGTVPEWAEVTDVTTQPAGPALAAGGALLALIGAAYAVIRPRPAAARADKYRTPGQLREDAEEAEAGGELAAQNDSGEAAEELSEQDSDRLLWDSLDAGDDPTASSDGTR